MYANGSCCGVSHSNIPTCQASNLDDLFSNFRLGLAGAFDQMKHLDRPEEGAVISSLERKEKEGWTARYLKAPDARFEA